MLRCAAHNLKHYHGTLTALRAHQARMASSVSKYASATRDELLARIAELEQRQDGSNGVHATSSQSGSTTSSATSAPIAVPVASTSALPAQNGDRPQATTTPAGGLKSKPTKSERKAILKQARANGNASVTSASLARDGSNSEHDESTFFERYASRKIALRFSYEGWLYGGLALQTDVSSISSSNALPTVEGVLLDALVSARLIRPSEKRDLEKLDFSRCGRTDRGVSAAGQVVSLYVRSQLGEDQGAKVPGWRPPAQRKDESTAEEPGPPSLEDPQVVAAKAKNKPRGELPYMSLLNRVLPSSIRILGWSPVTPEFDSRFLCQYRHYKYFFSSPPQSASASATASAALSIAAMQNAASRLVGEHDFRNLCKIDATKQITNFYRRVMSATISLVPPDQMTSGDDNAARYAEEQMYVFDLKGSAFLYHQVRHIMAILFLVGSGREDPSVVDALLNTSCSNSHTDTDAANTEESLSRAKRYPNAPIVDCKPSYEMAADLPLVLWDCAYPASTGLAWRQDSDTPDARNSKAYQEMLVDHTQLRIKETISAHFLQSYLKTGNACDAKSPDTGVNEGGGKGANTVIQLGAGKTARSSKYTALLQRPRSESAEVVNRKWAEGQGARRAERKARTEAEKESMELDK